MIVFNLISLCIYTDIMLSIGRCMGYFPPPSPRRGPESLRSQSVHVGYVADKAAVGQFLSESFGFLLAVSYRLSLILFHTVVVPVGRVGLCLWTAATSGPVVYPAGGIWV
jgi:hypothetical protein